MEAELTKLLKEQTDAGNLVSSIVFDNITQYAHALEQTGADPIQFMQDVLTHSQARVDAGYKLAITSNDFKYALEKI